MYSYPEALKERQPPSCFSSSSPKPGGALLPSLLHTQALFLFLRQRLRSDSFCSLSCSLATFEVPWTKGLKATSLLFLECPNTKERGKCTLGRHFLALSDTKGWSRQCTLLLAGPPLGPFLSVCPILSNKASFSKGQIFVVLFSGFAPLFSGTALTPGLSIPTFVIKWVTLR